MNNDTSEGSGIFTYVDQRNNPQPGISERPKSSRVAHFLVIGAATVVLLAGIKAASSLVGPILLALFLAIILLIPLRWLQDVGCPTFLSYVLVLGCTIAVFIGISYFVGKSLNEFIGKLPAYKDRIVDKFGQIDDQLAKFGFKITENLRPGLSPFPGDVNKPDSETPLEIPPETPSETPSEITKPEPVVQKIQTEETTKAKIPAVPADETETAAEDDDESEKEKLAEEDMPIVSTQEVEQWVGKMDAEHPSLIALDPQSVMYWIARSVLQLRHLIEGGFLVLIFTIFMLFEASRFPEKVDRAFGREGPISNEHFHHIAHDIRSYLVLKTISNIMSGGAAMFVYWLFGVPAAVFWGLMAFFLYYIPNIGGTLAAVIPGILIFMNYDIPGVLLYAACLAAIECSIAYGIEPKMLGHGLGLSTVVIILTLFFWGWILGPIGLFLAAPLTVMVKIILQAFPETKWIAILLDDNRIKK
jgi:predicted PurR-regulated permease PerM